MKRACDFVMALLALVVFAPLFLVCYLAVKLEDRGPAIFSQEGAEDEGPLLYSHENETRMTRTGKFLREHHLDELPQLWNVLKGDMAFVGPRPERKFFIDRIMERDPRYALLYQIRPGVTSYATLYNGYTDTMEKMIRRLELDLYYLEHRSWWLDFSILFKTFVSIVFGKKF